VLFKGSGLCAEPASLTSPTFLLAHSLLPLPCPQFQPSETLDVSSFPFASRWILSKLNGAVATTVKGLEAYEFSAATSVGRQLE
jgi:hypothetical protein